MVSLSILLLATAVSFSTVKADLEASSVLANTTEPATRSNTCIDPSDPAWRPVPCPTVKAEAYTTDDGTVSADAVAGSANVRVRAQAMRAPTLPSFSKFFDNSNGPGKAQPAPTSPVRVIDVELSCNAPAKVCDNVEKAFDFVNTQLAKVIRVQRTLKVDAVFHSFCKDEGFACDAPSGLRPIGTAGPTLLVPLPLTDDEKSKRQALFPQALAQQRRLSQHPQYAPHDIVARFSSDADVWFPEDGTPIKPGQTDFRWVALHEVIHGLGFGISSWRDWTVGDQTQATHLTPFPVSDVGDYLDDGFTFSGQFFQTAFDTGIVNAVDNGWQSGNLKLSKLVKYRMDGFAGEKAREFASVGEFREALLASTAGRRAASVQAMVHRRDRGIAFNPLDGSSMIMLATGPKLSGINPGSLIGHLDGDTYTGTTNFLMTPVVESGITLEDKWRKVGGKSSDMRLAGGAVERVLRFMGYQPAGGAADFFGPSRSSAFDWVFAMSARKTDDVVSAAAYSTASAWWLCTVSIAVAAPFLW